MGNIIKSGKQDNNIWRALGGTTGGNTNGEPTDESVDSSYGQYAGIYYSQRAYMNEIKSWIKEKTC